MGFIGNLFVLICLFGLVGVFKITPLHQKLKLTKRWHNVVLMIVASLIASPFLPKDQPQVQPQQETKSQATVEVQAQTKSAKPQSTYASFGENGVTKDYTFFAFSKNDFDELMSYASANNKEAVQEMENQGKVLVLYPGTKVTVIDVKDATSFVEVKSGPFQGNRGYVPSDLIVKK